MKTLLTSLKKAFPILAAGIFILFLSACGTQNQTYNSSDGIYASEDVVATDDSEQEVDKTNYYKQYFKSKTGSYEELPEEGAIFTDIDAYTTTDSLDEDGYIITEEVRYEEGYGSWGTNSDNVIVNIYGGGGWGYGGWGYGGWGINNGWGYGGWGINNGWGYGGWGIGYGWGFNGGWGYPYYGGFYCPPFYGGYYNPHYYNGYGYGNNIAYNRGRRNTDYLAGRSNSRNRSNRDVTGRDSYARSEMNRRGTTSRTRPSAERASSPRSEYGSRPTSRPTSRPSTRPTSRPTSRPSTRPASMPSTRPSSSRPSSRPSSSSRGGGRSSGSRSGGGRGGRG